MMTAADIINILTAATPFVASLTPIFKASENKEKKEKQEPISVTINNNFYTNSEKDAVSAAQEINNQVVGNMYRSGTRYTL